MYLLRVTLTCLALAGISSADTLTLKDGSTVTGTYIGGSARQIRIAVGDNVQTFDIDQIVKLEFQPLPAAPPEPAPAAPPPAQAGVELPAGTPLTVRMIDAVDSRTNRIGQTFQASIDEPVMVNEETVIPRGADVVAKLVEDKESGKITGRTELKLVLVTVKVNDRLVDVSTDEVTRASNSRSGRSGKVIGGTAALGAILGGIAGGGGGAAIGAASGAAVGTGVQAATKGERVHIPSETRLTFKLANPVRI